MKKLGNLGDWFDLSVKKPLNFSRNDARVVRLIVNASSADIMIRLAGEKDGRFLCHAHGLEVVTFSAPGAFQLYSDATCCQVSCAELKGGPNRKGRDESFTRPYQRPEISPVERELMMIRQERANLKAERLRAAQADAEKARADAEPEIRDDDKGDGKPDGEEKKHADGSPGDKGDDKEVKGDDKSADKKEDDTE